MKNKKILVTGSDGFIGSHLTEALVEAGYDVRALVYYNSFNSNGWLDTVSCRNDIQIISGDIRDPLVCNHITKNIDVIFHLAALIAIPYSYAAPDSYIDTNVKGTLNICNAALANQVERVVTVSTSEVYGSAQYVPIDEQHPLQPQSPYSASKIGADAIAMSFYNSFNLPLVIARPFNTFGPRQSARAIIPTIISQIASGLKTIKVGDTKPTRDFNYVLDTVSGLMKLAFCSSIEGETVNIGSNYEISVEETLQLIAKLMNVDIDFVVDQERIRPVGSEVERLWCDNSKILKLTGFKPQYTFEAGLLKTIEWFKEPNNLSKYKVDKYNV